MRLDYLRPRPNANKLASAALSPALVAALDTNRAAFARPETRRSCRFRHSRGRTGARISECAPMYGKPSGVSANSPSHAYSGFSPASSGRSCARYSRSRPRATAIRRREPFDDRWLVSSPPDEQPPISGPPEIVIRAVGIPRHHPTSCAGAKPPCREDVGVLHPEPADQPAKFRRGIPGRDDDARGCDRAARFALRRPSRDAFTPRACERSKISRAPAAAAARNASAGPHGIDLRVARGRDRRLRSDAGHPIERRRRKPSPWQAGLLPCVELASQRLDPLGIEREVHGVASAQTGIELECCDRFRKSRVARASDFQIPRAAARPNRAARSVKSRSGSCISRAVLAAVLPRATSFDSRSATRTPASAKRYAQIAPVMPPPIMTTSASQPASMSRIFALWPVVDRAKADDRDRRRRTGFFRFRFSFYFTCLGRSPARFSPSRFQ